MMTGRKRAAPLLAAVLAAATLWACGRGVPATVLLAPSLWAGVRTVAVRNLTGPHAAEVARVLNAELPGHPGLDRKPLGMADLEVTGRVEWEMTEETGTDLVQAGKEAESIREIPFTARHASLTLVWRVAGETDGEQTLTVRLDRKYGGVDLLSAEGERGVPPVEDTVREAATVLAEDLARRLVPAEERLKLVLDTGKGLLGEPEIIRGVEAAARDDWDEARRIWGEVLAADPEHPAAQYNMGVSEERLGGKEHLEAAREHYAQALRNGSNPIYREALTRVVVALRHEK